MAKDIIMCSLFFILTQSFALPAFIGLDYNTKATKKKLIDIKKYKWLFVKYSKEINDKIGIISFIFQIFHYLICLCLLILTVTSIAFNMRSLLLITIYIYLSYLIYSFILMIIIVFISLYLDNKIEKKI